MSCEFLILFFGWSKVEFFKMSKWLSTVHILNECLSKYLTYRNNKYSLLSHHLQNYHSQGH